MQTKESMENYLETILLLQERYGNVRAIDIATELEFSKPSVSNALKKLRAAGYVTMVEKTHIVLTEEGRAIAKAVYERHCVISNLLMDIGVSQKTALEDACRIEHIITDETFTHMKQHYMKNKSTKESL